MASADVILCNLGATLLVSLYVFGGETPWVSQTTAVAVGILQFYSLLTSVVVSGAKTQKKMKLDEEETADYACRARQCVSCIRTFATEINSTVRCLGGMFAVFMLSRFLRTSGFITTAYQAIPLALVIGVISFFAAASFCPDEPALEGSSDSAEELPLGGAKSPYNGEFWGEFEPIVANTDPIEMAPSESSEILSDVLYELYMK